jgi:hypothetical protein
MPFDEPQTCGTRPSTHPELLRNFRRGPAVSWRAGLIKPLTLAARRD